MQTGDLNVFTLINVIRSKVMGSTLSTRFKEAMEAESKEVTTPQRRIHRILGADFDPRSPTVGVDRTPIAISVSPLEEKNTNSSPEVFQTPQSEPVKPFDQDPRSPTEGILRTPIHFTGLLAESVIDPRSPTVGVPRTPIVIEADDVDTHELGLQHCSKFDSVPNIDAIPPIADLDLEVMNRSLSEPDLSKDDVRLSRQRNGSSNNTFRESTPKKKSVRKVIYQGLSDDDLTSKSLQVKDRSPHRMRDAQRSPLSLRTNVDVNSPRNIVQRKQVNKLNLSIKGSKVPKKCGLQSPSRYQALDQIDKENLIDF